MTITLNGNEFDSLRQLIEQECGIAVGDDKVYLLESRLSKLAIENDCENFTLFYHKVKQDQALKNKVIDAMTTNETLWFRDNSPYEWFKNYAFPELTKKIIDGDKKDIRIWSAACSTGQEPYSISMMYQESLRTNNHKQMLNDKLSIVASDISPSVLFIAKNARYDALSMSRGMQDDLKQRYFEESGRVFILKNEIKERVQFQQLNLLNSMEHLGKFDVILLRNVAIYFSKEVKIQLFRKLAMRLNPNGYLLVGASESLLGYSQDFKACEHNNYNFYQLK